MSDYEISKRYIMPLPPPPSAEVAKLMEDCVKEIEAQFLLSIFGGYSDPAPPRARRCCSGTVLHSPNCKYWCTAT